MSVQLMTQARMELIWTLIFSDLIDISKKLDLVWTNIYDLKSQ
jgi:hypothetical protein